MDFFSMSKWLSVLLIVGITFLIPSRVRAEESIRLTQDSLFKRDPTFVDQGKAIVFVLLERPEQLRLMKLDLASGKSSPLHQDENRSELEPRFSRDGRYYAYIQSRSPASVAMVIRDAKEKKEVEIPPESGFSGMRSPVFAHDGSRIYYSFAEEGRQQIFSVDLQAANRKKVVDSRGINNWPDISPDGKHIVFSSTRDGNYEIYLSKIDGSELVRVTESPFMDIRPRISPDGKRIAFVSTRDGNYELYVVDVDGTNLVRITNHAERDDFPDWHPEGKRLVSVSERAGRKDLYLFRVP